MTTLGFMMKASMASRRCAWQRGACGLVLSALSALLMILAFPPYGLWPLIGVGLVPMIVAQHRVLPARLSGLASAVGVGGFFAGYFGSMFAGGPWLMQALPAIIAVVAGLLGARDRAFHARTGHRWLVWHGAAVWVAFELLRGVIPVLGTWGLAAYALYDQPWLIQPIALLGVYGLSLLILLLNYTLGLGALALYDRYGALDPGVQRVDPTLARHWVTATTMVLVVWVGASLALESQATNDAPQIRVAAIQPAFKIQSDRGLEKMADLTRRAAEQGAELIVWHEGALPFDPQVEHTGELRALAAETEAYLVVGYGVRTAVGYRNEAVILSPEGTFLGPFGKDHPVAWSGETSVTRGPYTAYDTALGPLGMMICYDLDFTGTARRIASRGAKLIAVPSFDWPAIADKHYTHLVFRAVENRVAAVKADVAFDSAILAPDGRIVASAVARHPAQQIVVADVPMGTGRAPAGRWGDWVGWLCLIGAVCFLALDLTTGRKSRRAQGSGPQSPGSSTSPSARKSERAQR